MKQRLIDNKNDMKKREQQNRNLIKEMVNKGRSGKLLIDRYQEAEMKRKGGEMAGNNAILMVEGIMKQNLVDPNKHLSEAQKDRLADAKFLQKHGR